MEPTNTKGKASVDPLERVMALSAINEMVETGRLRAWWSALIDNFNSQNGCGLHIVDTTARMLPDEGCRRTETNLVAIAKDHICLPFATTLDQCYVEIGEGSQQDELYRKLIRHAARWAEANEVSHGYVHTVAIDDTGFVCYCIGRNPTKDQQWLVEPIYKKLVDRAKTESLYDLRNRVLGDAVTFLEHIACGGVIADGSPSQLCQIVKRINIPFSTHLSDELYLRLKSSEKAQIVVGFAVLADGTKKRYLAKTFGDDASFEFELHNMTRLVKLQKEWQRNVPDDERGPNPCFCAVCPVLGEDLPLVLRQRTQTLFFDRIGAEASIDRDATAYFFWKELKETLTFLHKHNVYHLDISPWNLVLVRESENYTHLCLIDFGSCETISSTSGDTAYQPKWITRSFGLPITLQNEQPGSDRLRDWDIFALCMSILCLRLPREASKFYEKDSNFERSHRYHEMCLRKFLGACTSRALQPIVREALELLDKHGTNAEKEEA